MNKQTKSENTKIQVELKKIENLISSQNILILKNDKNIISLVDRSKKKSLFGGYPEKVISSQHL